MNLQGHYAISLASLSTLQGLHYASYATILSQVIIAHPTVLLLPSAVAGTTPSIAYPVSIGIAAAVGLFVWRLGVDGWELAVGGLIWFGELHP